MQGRKGKGTDVGEDGVLWGRRLARERDGGEGERDREGKFSVYLQSNHISSGVDPICFLLLPMMIMVVVSKTIVLPWNLPSLCKIATPKKTTEIREPGQQESWFD